MRKTNRQWGATWFGLEECPNCWVKYPGSLDKCPQCKHPNQTKLEELKKKYIVYE